MSGDGGSRKGKVKVKSFLPSWLHQSIDGHKAGAWLKPDSKDSGRGVFSVCPSPNSFSINQGWKSVKQQFGTKMHQEHLKSAQTNPEFKQANFDVPKITEDLKKMEELQQTQLASKEKALRAQVVYTAEMMYHGASGNFIDLMVEVAALKVQGSTGDPDKMEVDEFFSNLSKVTDDEGNLVFPLLSKLGSALATLYNSSSMAERDFSLMNAIVSDKSRTSQLLLLAKMYIKAEIMGLARSCKQCKVLSSVDEDGRHCHCHLWQPTDELMETMRGGQPYRRYKADLEKRKQEEEDKQVLKDLNAQEDERKRLLDLKEEVVKMRKRVERQDKEDAEKKKNEAAKKAAEATEKKKGNKKRKSSKAEEKRSEQRKKLKVD